MPVSVFENRFEAPLKFSLEPGDETYELPPLTKVGVRYSFALGEVNRTFADFSEGHIRFWCNAEARDVEITYPSPFDLLLWDICVNGGCCGGPAAHVTDLLPKHGTITATEFAQLVIQAEEGGSNEAWLATKFTEHMGQSSAAAEALVQNLANPFDSVTG